MIDTIQDYDPVIDINNNNDPMFTSNKEFNEEKRFDSGLEIITPKSNESLIFSVSDQNGNIFRSMPSQNKVETSTTKPNKMVELRLDDIHNIDKPTKLVIYQNHDGQTKHFQLSDSRGIPLKRSKTFSESPLNDDDNLSKSSGFILFCSSQDLCGTPNETAATVTDSSPNMPEELFDENDTAQIAPEMVDKKPHFARLFSCFNFCKCIFNKIQKKNNKNENVINIMSPPEYYNENDPVEIYDICEEVEFCDATGHVSNDPAEICYDLCEEVEFCDSGGQSVVYKAVYKGDPVILKTITRLDNIDMSKMLALNHDNVVKFLGYSVREASNNRLHPTNYLVMEMCDKKKLYDFIQLRDHEINPNMIYAWINQICDGMVYLHSHGIIHRDLKSLNVLVKDNMLKIVDFRVEKNPSSCNLENNDVNSVIGTYPWMSPEALQGLSPTKKVDVWSFGVIIWELITRKIPFDQISEYAIMYGVIDGSLKLPIPDDITQGLKNILNDCWKIDPISRPSFFEIKERLPAYFREFNIIQADAFVKLQEEWAIFVEGKYQTMSKSQMSNGKIEQEIIRKRNDELKDAREIKNMYKEKLARVETLINKIKFVTPICDLNAKFLEFLRMDRDIEKKFREFCNDKKSQLKPGDIPKKQQRSASKQNQKNSTIPNPNSINVMWRSYNNDNDFITIDGSRNFSGRKKTNLIRKSSEPVNRDSRNHIQNPGHIYQVGMPQSNKKQKKKEASTSQSCEILTEANNTISENSTPQKQKTKRTTVMRSSTDNSPRDKHSHRRSSSKTKTSYKHNYNYNNNHNSSKIVHSNVCGSTNPSFNSSIDSLKDSASKISRMHNFWNKAAPSSYKQFENPINMPISPFRPSLLGNSSYPSRPDSLVTSVMEDSIMSNSINPPDDDGDQDMPDTQNIITSEDSSHQSPPDVMLRVESGRRQRKTTQIPSSQPFPLTDSLSNSLQNGHGKGFDTIIDIERRVDEITTNLPSTKPEFPNSSSLCLTDSSVNPSSNRNSYNTNTRPKTTTCSDINMWSPSH